MADSESKSVEVSYQLQVGWEIVLTRGTILFPLTMVRSPGCTTPETLRVQDELKCFHCVCFFLYIDWQFCCIWKTPNQWERLVLALDC